MFWGKWISLNIEMEVPLNPLVYPIKAAVYYIYIAGKSRNFQIHPDVTNQQELRMTQQPLAPMIAYDPISLLPSLQGRHPYLNTTHPNSQPSH